MIEIITAGLYTTVQDLGRFGHRNIGVPVSGAMDGISAKQANSLLGNETNSALLEIIMTGPTLKFHKNTTIAIAGAPFEVLLNATEIVTNKLISIQKNNVLTIGKAKKGMYCYLAVVGGLQTPMVLNSRSYYANITQSTKLERGAKLAIHTFTGLLKMKPSAVKEPILDRDTLAVHPGPEYEFLTIFEQQGILEQKFTISTQSNRMASVLACNLRLSAKEIPTAPVQPGTVQLTPSGKVIVLMRDAQVTGGYARIFQLTEESIPILAQKRGGEQVRIQLANALS